MDDLNTLTERYGSSVARLRRLAFERCGVPEDASEGLVDLWLYERLAKAVHTAGPHFYILDDDSAVRMIEHSLAFIESGTFEEKCAASWAELVANPIIRHEIMLPWTPGRRVEGSLLDDCWRWPREDYGDVAASLPLSKQGKRTSE